MGGLAVIYVVFFARYAGTAAESLTRRRFDSLGVPEFRFDPDRVATASSS